ncbi:RNA polymerase subunit RPABC4/transcription elongation factor Spt4 [Streptosporangium becharense]|uniref:RNA polymerase subunit RPABC4/transcription elongation factor Spt4 n=1 Tax=Streptosporangium becharense TaxID=1816182 RepID=A0A7W9IFL3_9ACTN|nr:hypothetical protein [Streptosporangium becharense]MBB2909156.1 RNA polymerase subunit RPABC4/transcription elongation factor Spt4 [Streptosporangium becharense]MBB5819825.1 RNA polymerase subunit RPABC4/transcription elongation factor Spt4 [Streptosporangium becharense]
MARFSCPDCGSRSCTAIGCRRCGTATARPIQRCPVHGARCLAACRMCRTIARSQSGL